MANDIILSFAAAAGQFEAAYNALHGDVARAAKRAIVDAGNDAKIGGRKAIAKGGFSTRFQNALRLDVYPQGDSINAVAVIRHATSYAGVFQNGAIIQGRPFLWLPTDNVPKKIGRGRTTIRKYMSSTRASDMRFARGKKGPMLVGKPRGKKKSVVLFVGVPIARIGKKFDVLKPAEQAADRLASYYIKYLGSR